MANDGKMPLPYKPLNRAWAKAEIFLGLTAAGIGMGLGFLAVFRLANDWAWTAGAAALALFTLGGYLAMAGHRSHLYQSLNEQTNILLQQIQSMKDKTS